MNDIHILVKAYDKHGNVIEETNFLYSSKDFIRTLENEIWAIRHVKPETVRITTDMAFTYES